MASDVPFLHGGFPFLRGEVSMRSSLWRKLVLTAGALAILSGALAFGQSASTDESKRKAKTKVLPLYPDLAKRMNVTGKVKIEVVITPEGRVKSTRVVGGHPLLVQAWRVAGKGWILWALPNEAPRRW